MGKKICVDTGIIALHYSKDVPESISQIMSEIKEKKIEAHVVFPTISEAFYHICKLNGKVAAESTIASFLSYFPIKLINLNKSLVIKAGLLKCQHGNVLSYNDCFGIAHALNKKITLHTTEKGLKQLLPDLKIKTYGF